MTTYIVMYILFFMITFFAKKIKGNREKKRCVHVFLIYGIITILFSLRHPGMGVDLGYFRGYGYLSSFEKISDYSWLQIFSLEGFLNYEMGYVWFCKLLSYISSDPQMLLIGCAIVSIVPIAITIYEKSSDVLFSTIIYMALPIFSLLFSGLRQGIAIAICFYSIRFIETREWKKFLLLIVIAMLFHTSAFLFLIAYPVYHLTLDKKWRMASVPLIFVVYILRYPLFSILSKLLKENAVPDNNGAITLLIIFTFIYCFCIVFSKQDKQLNGYMNIFYIGCLCQCFGGVYNTAIRIGYYFMGILCLLLPLTIKKINDYATHTIIKIVLYICFVVYGITAITNNSLVETDQYYWFWQMPSLK